MNRAIQDAERAHLAILIEAIHFNTLHELLTVLYSDAGNSINYCKQTLAIDPETPDFEKYFTAIIQKNRHGDCS